MSQKSGKKKSKKGAKDAASQSVLGNLPSTRPTRLGGTRTAATTGRTRTAARPTAAAATPAKPDSRTKPAARTKAPPKPAAEPKHTPPPDRDGRRAGPPTGVELVTTAARAAGELTQIGFTVGRQMLKRAADRLPRP